MTAPTATLEPDTGAVEHKVRRLSSASARRVIEPDTDVPGHVGDGQVLPDELLSVAGLDLDLTAEQRRTLSREEVASITIAGIKFEAVLEAGFAHEIFGRDVTDPRVEFLLHEIGEETRHQRLFIRMVHDLAPQARNPLEKYRVLRFLERRGIHLITSLPALLYTLVLGGEEIPDLLQKRAAEHPDTDPFIREVNKYHRQEEARHLSYARALLPEIWADAGPVEKLAVRYIAPLLIADMFNMLVHPGVYETVGLDDWATWKAVRASEKRQATRHEATRPVLNAVVDAGALKPGRIPKPWRELCGVNRHGEPIAS